MIVLVEEARVILTNQKTPPHLPISKKPRRARLDVGLYQSFQVSLLLGYQELRGSQPPRVLTLYSQQERGDRLRLVTRQAP